MILMLAILRSYLPQVMDKIDSQFIALKRLYPRTACVVLGPEQPAQADNRRRTFNYITISALEIVVPYLNTWTVITDIINALQPRVVCMRYPSADRNLLELVRGFPRKIIFQHQTKELEEFKSLPDLDRFHKEEQYGVSCLQGALALTAVTPDIAAYQQKRLSAAKPTLVLPNGIDVQGIPLRKKSNPSAKRRLLSIAQFNYWNGLDRLIEGLADYSRKQDFCVHMVGFGSQLEPYKQLIRKYGLSKQFIFEGYLDKDKIDPLAARCDVGLGVLAPHRKGLNQTAALKHREYCLRGMPFVFGGEDPDFPGNLPFVHSFPATEEPLDILPLETLYNKESSAEISPDKIRQYALTHLLWSQKMSMLLDFVDSVVPPDREPLQNSQDITGVVDKLMERYHRQGIQYLRGENNLNRTWKYRLASLYQAVKDWSHAKPIFRELLADETVGKMRGGIYFHLGRIAEKEGDITTAVENLEQCLIEIPDHKLAGKMLEELE